MSMHFAHFSHEIWLVLLLLLAAVFISCFIIRRRTQSGNADRRDSLEILKKRLAAGEITIDEFNMIRQVL